jgi:hypothetical protein
MDNVAYALLTRLRQSAYLYSQSLSGALLLDLGSSTLKLILVVKFWRAATFGAQLVMPTPRPHGSLGNDCLLPGLDLGNWSPKLIDHLTVLVN